MHGTCVLSQNFDSIEILVLRDPKNLFFVKNIYFK